MEQLQQEVRFIIPNYLVELFLDDIYQRIVGREERMEGIAGGVELVDVAERLKEHLRLTRNIVANKHHDEGITTVQELGAMAVAAGAPRVIPELPVQNLYNMGHAVDPRFMEDIRSGDEQRYLPGDSIPPNFDQTSREVFDNVNKVYKFYRDVFQRDSLDGRHMALVSSIHFGKKYANAFWTDRLSQMVFGDGDPLLLTNITSSLDVVGHEMTHGFLSKQSDLTYRNESGALNESIADIFGSMILQYSNKQSVGSASWLIGEGTVPTMGKALRSMSNEPANNYDIQPKHVDDMKSMQRNEKYQDYIRNDNGGVHIFSGIPNHAFYKFAHSFGNEAYSWEIPGQVWYNTVLSGKLRKSATFSEFAALTVGEASKFNKETSKKLKEAWTAVGVAYKL